MSDDESPLSRWSRLKRRARAGAPAPETPEPAKKHGDAAPVAGRRLVRSLPPLAGADQDPDDPYAAPPIVRAYGLPPAAAPAADADGEEDRALTPEEQEAVKDLPPIDSLNKDSDFTPFLADKVPDFIRRKALSVLWRSDPVLANLDGLNDYDEDFTFAAVVAESLADAKEARKLAKAAEAKAEKADAEKAGDGEPAETAEVDRSTESADDSDSDNVGEADGDGGETDPGRLPAPAADDLADADADEVLGGDLVRPPGTPPRRH